MNEDINTAKVKVTFYFGDGHTPLYTLVKTYLLQHWKDLEERQQWLHELAHELNHLSGYGIGTIQATTGDHKITLEFNLPPHDLGDALSRYWFNESLRFKIIESGRAVWLDIPRLTQTAENYAYEPNDPFFKIKTMAIRSRKAHQKETSRYWLRFDDQNPHLRSFVRKIANAHLVPNLKRRAYTNYHDEEAILRNLSWWKLPRGQSTVHKLKKNRQKQEKKQRKIDRAKQTAEKIGREDKEGQSTELLQYVYFIKIKSDELDKDLYKIGVSHNPTKRLHALQTASPFALTLVHHFVAEPAAEAERLLHQQYKQYQMKGEWFMLPDDVIERFTQIERYQNGRFTPIPPTPSRNI